MSTSTPRRRNRLQKRRRGTILGNLKLAKQVRELLHRTFLCAGVFIAVCLLSSFNDYFPSLPERTSWTPADWEGRREAVKQAFVTSWDAYEKYAFGQDRFHPITKTGSNMSPNGLGWIIVDSLDSMMIMNLTSRLESAQRWVRRHLDYDQVQDVNTFESTICMLGGLLSAHYLSTQLSNMSSQPDSVYLNKSIDLAGRLLGAYESRSGVPYARVQLNTAQGIRSHADIGALSIAEATTLQIEMKYLSYLTGNETYWRKAEHVVKVVDDNMVQDGLIPIFIDPETGRFIDREIRLGSRGDSYYEYLVKQYLHTSEKEPVYLQMWEEALAGIRKHLIIPTKYAQLTTVAELPDGIGGPLCPKIDHLVCFIPGAIALGATGGLTETKAKALPTWTKQKAADMKLARELLKTCWGMYKVTETGIAPEIAWFNWKKDYIIKPLNAHNLQRPETVKSLLTMWRIIGDQIYREWGWLIFQAFQKYGLLEDGEGYTSLDDVNAIPPPRRDNTESFWLAETLKYLYLLFGPDDYLPLTDVVFNTEAHALPRIKTDKFGTGWERRPRLM